MTLPTRVGPRLALGIALSLLAASSARAEDEPREPGPPLPQWGQGPFEISDPYALAEVRLSPYARSPRTLTPLELEVGARGYWENSYGLADNQPVASGHAAINRIAVDAETRSLTLVARMGIFPRIELGAELETVHWRGGGVLDNTIMGFHRLLQQGSLRRYDRPRNAYLVSGTDPGGKPFDLDGRGVGLGDGALSARFLAFEGGDYHPAVALTLRVFLPTASQKFGHAHELAASLALDASKRILDLPLVVYAGGALTHGSEPTVSGMAMVQDRFMGYVGFEWEIRPWLSAVIHFWAESPRERKIWRHTDIPYKNEIQYVAFGLKWKPIDGLTVELGGLENFHDPNTTGDFGILLNVWYDFGTIRASSDTR